MPSGTGDFIFTKGRKCNLLGMNSTLMTAIRMSSDSTIHFVGFRWRRSQNQKIISPAIQEHQEFLERLRAEYPVSVAQSER